MDKDKLGDLQAVLSKEITEAFAGASYLDKPRHVSKVMALILNMLDMSGDRAKLEAVGHLTFVLEKASPELLDNYGYFDVIFDALFRLILFQNMPLLNSAYSCFLRFLSVQQNLFRNKPRAPKYGQLDYADRLLLQSLQNVFLFSSEEIRVCLIGNVISLVQNLGFRSSKFFPRMLAVSDHLIETGSYDKQALSVKFLLDVSTVCSPAFGNHSEKLLLQATKVLLHLNPETDSPLFSDLSSLFKIVVEMDKNSVDFVESVLAKDAINSDFRDKLYLILSLIK
ncbi:hypothetical protein RvY_18542 [Ramazzottius varieornatus]|uniref:Uncharacterized protein n=1 Tax=Ramazzottius varieornatus TaxID=947166 RepID=A0A1D1W7P5_RAMVA|nr:hypothetical protein RvY_18542 [Ramazzottius varieornatus]